MVQCSSEKSFYCELTTEAEELYLGFSVSNGYTVAVVPRFWFPEPEDIPPMRIDDGKIIVLPDKGSRIIQSNEKIDLPEFQSEKERY